jgi:hypothetical protein
MFTYSLKIILLVYQSAVSVCVWWFPSPPPPLSYPVSLLLQVSHTRLLTKMLWNCPPTCASHRAAPLCPLTSPFQALV